MEQLNALRYIYRKIGIFSEMAAKKKQKTNKVSAKRQDFKASKAHKPKREKTIWPAIETYGVSKRTSIILFAIMMVISFFLYVQTLPYEFVLDDQIVVSENSFVKEGISGINDLLLTESFVGYFGEQKDLIPGARYRPLSMITYAIEYRIFGGLNSRMNHLFNVILYGLCGWLVFLGLSQFFSRKKVWWLSIPFLATVIWMFHPVHIEVVANIKGRDEIMSLIFSMLSLLSAFAFYRWDSKKWLALISLIISFLLGLLSKETTLTFLAVIPTSLYFFRESSISKMLSVVSAIVVAFIAYLALRYIAVGYFFSGTEVTDVMNNPFVGMAFHERLATVFYVLLKYVGLSFVPYPLTHDYYPFQIPRVGWLNLWVIVSVVVHLLLAAFAAVKFKSRNLWAYIIFFYISTLSIASNIVVNVGTTMNERFLFTPSIAAALAIIWALKSKIPEKTWKKYLMLSSTGLICIVFAIVAFQRIPVWENALTLNTAAVKVSTNSARSNSFMATAMFEEAKTTPNVNQARKKLLNEAMIYADRATKILPTYSNGNLMKAGIAAEIHKIDQKLPPLLKAFKEVAAVRPGLSFMHEYLVYIKNRSGGEPDLMKFLYETGYEMLILEKRDYQWGLKFLNYYYDVNPYDPKVTYAISQGYRFLGNETQAEYYLGKTLSLDPNFKI